MPILLDPRLFGTVVFRNNWTVKCYTKTLGQYLRLGQGSIGRGGIRASPCRVPDCSSSRSQLQQFGRASDVPLLGPFNFDACHNSILVYTVR